MKPKDPDLSVTILTLVALATGAADVLAASTCFTEDSGRRRSPECGCAVAMTGMT